MRLRRSDLRRRVNGRMQFRFGRQDLTSHAGLELVREYLVGTGFVQRLRERVSQVFPRTDFGPVSLILLVLGLLIVGGRRIRHLRYLKGDPMLRRFAGLRRIPATTTVSSWLASLGEEQVLALVDLNAEVVAAGIRAAELSRLTVDVDGSVLSTGLQVDGAQRGFNPHHRKVPSYYPITAYEAQSGQILRVENRSGNVHDGKASLGFLEDLVEQIEGSVGRGLELEFRMDGGFFRRDVMEFLESHRAEWAIKVPFYPWLNLKSYVAEAPEWQRVDEKVSSCESRVLIQTWDRGLRVVLYRKRVWHRTRKNFQLDLFDPNDGTYEYSAIATNKTLTGRNLWHFLNGRGAHEKAYGELKNGFAFSTIPSQKYAANSAWQVLCVVAFNLMRRFQAATTASRRRGNRKRRPVYRFASIHTLRYKILGRAGVLLHPDGRATLDVGCSPAVREDFSKTLEKLRKAA